jgi:hypothetical protein
MAVFKFLPLSDQHSIQTQQLDYRKVLELSYHTVVMPNLLASDRHAQ